MKTSWPIIKLNAVDSTNNYANALLAENKLITESAITAYSQFSGRGQQGNNWQSEPGQNLTFSLALFTSYIPVNEQFSLSIAISLGITDYLTKQNVQAKVKWPNDIFVGNKKIAGILIENSVMGKTLLYSVIGIGININQIVFDEDLSFATSLKQITKKEYILEDELIHVLTCLYERVLQLKENKFGLHKNEYMSRLLGYKEKRKYKSDGIEFYGTINDIKPFGELVILADDGSTKSFMFKEVEQIQ